MSDRLLTATDDAVVLRALQRLGTEANVAVHVLPDPAGLTAGTEQPLAVVIDLEVPGASGTVRACKERWPETLVAGFVAVPGTEAWRAAEEAGCDLVATRGAIGARLRARIADWRAHPGGRRLPLVDLADVAGRLGLVARLTDTPVGPVAVYHIGGELFALGDVCPHAGAALSEGEVLVGDALVSCPRHGSRFDIRSGARMRGPADDPIPVYPVVVEAGRAYLRLP